MKKIILFIYRRLFARPIFYKLNYGMYILSLKGMGVLNFENNRVSGEWHFISKVLRQFKQPVILDVGSNEGDYAHLCKTLCPESIIYAFEPHPKTFERLSKRVSKLGVRVFQNAVSNVSGDVTLFDYATSMEGTSHASLYGNVISDLRGEKMSAIKVSALLLDEFLPKNDISHVNLLKIDAEGHELKILEGVREYLLNHKVDIIHFEFNEMNVVSKTFMKDFYNLLSDYTFYRMLPNSLLPLGEYRSSICEIFLYQNVVAIRNDGELNSKLR